MTTAAMAIHPFTQANPMANGSKTDTETGTAATISANDFLTLLVTEMKNQDPTAQTDPNEYVNQLVQVNSLEQLIEIKENLSAGLGGPAAEAAPARINAAHSSGTIGAVRQNSGEPQTKGVAAPVPISSFGGNLGVSRPIPAAQRIAQALGGRQ